MTAIPGNESHFLHSFSLLVKTRWKHFNLIILTKHLMLRLPLLRWQSGIIWAEPPLRDFLRLRAKLRNVVALRRTFSFGRWPQHWGADSHWSSGGGVEVASLQSRTEDYSVSRQWRIIRRILSKWKYICALYVVVKHPERHLWSGVGVTWSSNAIEISPVFFFFPCLIQ